MSSNNTGYVFSNTANIYFQVFGEESKPAIILIHGHGEDWHTFNKQIKPFSKLYKIVTIDSRGHGRSSFGMYPLTIEFMANDVFRISSLYCLFIYKSIISWILKRCWIRRSLLGSRITIPFITTLSSIRLSLSK